MKLEELLGDELYSQVQAKLDEVNGNEPDKLKHVRFADLSEGNYVNKNKHEADVERLNGLIKGKDTEIETANTLIAQLKKDTKGNEELQEKITTYESQVNALQNELAETKLKSAIKVALLSEKAVDVDYLTYKLEEKLKESGETLELDENDNIKGWQNRLDGLKTQFPKMFEPSSEEGGGFEPYEPGGLPRNNNNKTVTKEQFNAMTYEQRVRLKNENEKLYHNLAKNSKERMI